MTKENVISLDLTVQKDGNEYTVGSPITRNYIRVPQEAVDIIKIVDGIKNLGEIESEYHRLYSGQDIDVLDFIDNLMDLNLVMQIDNKYLYPKENINKKTSKFSNILGLLFFSKPFIALYFITIGFNLIILLNNREMIPSYNDFFVYNKVGISFLFFFLISWLSTFFHEAAHFLAARKYNVDIIFNLSIRYHWIVIEADMSPIWSIETNKRYIPFLAGFFWDSLGLSVCLLIKMISTSEALLNISNILALLFFYRSLWQFFLFLRTDFYYVIINFFKLSELHNIVTSLFKNFFNKKVLENTKTKDKIVIYLYSVFVITGFFIALYMFKYIAIPGTIQIYLNIKEQIQFNNNWFNIADASIAIIIIFFQFFLWIKGAINIIKLRSK